LGRRNAGRRPGGAAKRLPQVGFLGPVVRADYDPAKDPLKDALLEGLKTFGYVEGKNIHVDYRVPRKPEEVAEMARDLVGHKVDVIATAGATADRSHQARDR
jgi:hypothetical protein